MTFVSSAPALRAALWTQPHAAWTRVHADPLWWNRSTKCAVSWEVPALHGLPSGV